MSWTLFYPERPWTINKDRNWHPHVRAKKIKEWRTEFKRLAEEAEIPHCEFVNIDVLPILADRRLQDPAACVTAAKAAIDGIVDAGVITDDNSKFLGWIKFYPPRVVKGQNGLFLKIHEDEATATF